jgi:hypothetical protein
LVVAKASLPIQTIPAHATRENAVVLSLLGTAFLTLGGLCYLINWALDWILARVRAAF